MVTWRAFPLALIWEETYNMMSQVSVQNERNFHGVEKTQIKLRNIDLWKHVIPRYTILSGER